MVIKMNKIKKNKIDQKIAKVEEQIRKSSACDEKVLLDLYLGKISSAYKNIKLNNGIKEILELLRGKKIKTVLASSSKKKKL